LKTVLLKAYNKSRAEMRSENRDTIIRGHLKAKDGYGKYDSLPTNEVLLKPRMCVGYIEGGWTSRHGD